ncbi:MAG: discoidin domain-containing protein [Oligoflexia bacterium]|nr:discoidin domain-containing protein [Oligoflexia bacterium]
MGEIAVMGRGWIIGIVVCLVGATAFVLATLFGLAYAFYVSSPYPDSGFLLNEISSGGLFTIVNKYSNAYLAWRLNPLWVAVWNGYGQEVVASLMLGFVASGGYLVARTIRAPQSSTAELWPAVWGIAGSAAIPILFGLDTIVIAAFCWLPLFIFVLLRAESKSGMVLPILILSTLLALDADQFALPLALGGVALALAMGRSVSIWFAVTVPALRAFWIDTAEFPDYPPSAHVVPGYNTSEGLYSLLGPESPIPILDRSYIRELASHTGMMLLVLAILGMLVERRLLKRSFWSVVPSAVLVLAVCLLLDGSLVPPLYSQIAPLASISRLLPGLSLYPLAVIVSVGGVLLASIWLGSSAPTRLAPLWSLGALFIIALLGVSNFSNYPVMTAQGRQDLLKRGGLAPSAEFISPSLFIASQQGSDLAAINRPYSFGSLKEYAADITVSQNQSLASNLVDGDPKTTWYPYGGQFGVEWIQIALPELLPIDGIRLDPGAYRTDFPRGLKISAGLSCGSLELVYFSPDWQGEILFTPKGFPYFGEQSRVTVKLSAPHPVRCIRIEQMGNSPRFNWNVAEIELSVRKS